MSRNARIALVAALLIVGVLVAATLMAEPLVHPCPREFEQCGRICAGQQTRPAETSGSGRGVMWRTAWSRNDLHLR